MRINGLRICACVLSLSIISLCACASSSQTKAVSDNTATSNMDVNTLAARETAAETILENASADFIGHHPVEESFLFWVDENYEGDILSDIAAGGDFSNPQIWYDSTGESIHVLWARYEKQTGIGIYQMERIIWQEDLEDDDEINPDETVIEFTGDLSMADGMATTNYMEDQQGKLKDCFSDDLVDEMKRADLFVINNEFTYTTQGTPIEGKDYTFRSIPERVNYLEDIGVDVASLANNHTYDFGEVGLLDTLDTLHNAGYKTLGAGKDLSEAADPLYFIAGGRKIAIVAATQVERSYTYTKEATEDSPGVLKTLDPTRYVQEIQQADRNADIVLAIVHWGTEGNAMYGNDQVELANAFVNAGADVIIGGHTHCLQGIEYVSDVPCYYSLGNYWFSLADWMPEGYDTGLAKLHILSDGTINCEFVPCRFDDGVTRRMLDTAEAENLYSYIESISQTTVLSEAGMIEHR